MIIDALYLNIKKIAELKNIQQIEIAEKMGVNKNTVSNWFNGKNSMKAEMIPTIARILRVSISELYSKHEINILSEPESTYGICKNCEEKQQTINDLRDHVDTLKRWVDELEGKKDANKCG